MVPQVTAWKFAVADERPKRDDVSIQESNVLDNDMSNRENDGCKH